jgi:hypothetical protein
MMVSAMSPHVGDSESRPGFGSTRWPCRFVASRDMFFIKHVEWAFFVVPKRRDVLKLVALV